MNNTEAGTITLTIRDAHSVLNGVRGLPVVQDQKAAYTLAYIAQKCEQASRAFQAKQRAKFAEFAAPQEAGKPPNLPPEKQQQYTDAVEALLDEEIRIERRKVALANVLGSGAVTITPNVLSQLLPVLVED